MKNKKLIFLAFSFAALLFVSCNNQLKDTNTVKGDGIKANKWVTLNLSANDNYTEFTTVNNSSANRSIVSDSYKSDQLKFYLYGDNVTKGECLDLQEVTVTAVENSNNKKGKASLEIGSFVWDLRIVAYDKDAVPATLPTYSDAANAEDAVLADAVLVGRAYADLRGETNKVDFVLMPDGLKKRGEVKLKVYTGGWTMQSGYTAEISIIDHESGDEIYTLTNKKSSKSTVQSYVAGTNALPNTVPETANYTADGAQIDPGNNYDLQVKFSSNDNSKDYYWSDNLIVLPGKGAEQTVVIPETILYPPTAPSTFKASYVVPTSDKTQFYNVVFTWVRSSSKTEKNYELEIADLGVPSDASNTYASPTNAAEADTDDDAWTTLVGYSAKTTVERYGQDFYHNPYIWVAGSLKKASTTATAKLVLGNRYLARIRAVNEAGNSDWVYVEFDNPTSGTAFTSATINLYRITYQETDMYGGTVTYEDTSTGSAVTPDTVEYHCQNLDPGITILRPKRNESETSIKLTVTDHSEANWSYWKDYNTSSSEPATYTGFENITLIPVFAKLTDLDLHDDKDYIMSKTNITLSKVTGTGTLGSIDENNHLTIDINTVKSIKWVISYPTGIVYDYCYLTLSKTSNLNSYKYYKNINKDSLEFPVMDLTDCESCNYLAVLHYGINKHDGDNERNYTLPISISIQE